MKYSEIEKVLLEDLYSSVGTSDFCDTIRFLLPAEKADEIIKDFCFDQMTEDALELLPQTIEDLSHNVGLDCEIVEKIIATHYTSRLATKIENIIDSVEPYSALERIKELLGD